MRRNRNLVTGMLALVVSVIAIGLVYAGFTGTLNINGTGEVRASKWDIHFENLREPVLNGTANVVTPAQIKTGRTQIGDYAVTFATPGDYLVYTFDVVNDGNFNASLSSLLKSTPQCTGSDATSNANVCEYIIYELKYLTNYNDVSVGDYLAAGERETMFLKLTLEDDMPASKLAQSEVSVGNLGITLIYSQNNSYQNNYGGTIQANSERNISKFEYTVSNNEVTITGYKGLLYTYDVYNVSTCVSSGTQIIMDEYSLDETSAAYMANELCNNREVNGITLGSFLEQSNIAPGKYDEVGIRVYRASDVTKILDKTQCISGGTQLLIDGYGMDSATASYSATELCNGREVDGLTLQDALESKLVTSEYYSILGIDKAFLNKTGSVVIPNEIDGYPVTSIGDSAFYRNTITSVQLPSTLETIQSGAFERTNITNIEIPNGVTEIGYFAFGDSSLISVVIPNSVTSLGDYAFAYTGLKSVTIGNGITSIGTGVFDSDQLTSVTIPNSVTSIEDSAFRNNQLTSITIPNSVTSIGDNAFAYNQLTSVTLPNSLTTIGNNVFENNKLTSVTIPNSVTAIGSHAFAYNQLTSVTINNKTSSNDFSTYGSDIWGWNSGVTCIIDNTTKNANGCINWDGGYYVSGISLTAISNTIHIGDNLVISKNITPNNATNTNVTWNSSNPSVATVNSNGLVTGVSLGETTITATTEDGGYTGTINITVLPVSVTGISISPNSGKVGKNNTIQLSANITPNNAANKNITWSSSNPSIATVNSNGLVTGVNSGTATITATTVDGGYTASTIIEVKIISYITRQNAGQITAEDEVAIGEEHFYVVSSDNTNTVLLAKYDLKSDGNGSYMQDTSGTNTNIVKVNFLDNNNTAYWDNRNCTYNGSWSCPGSGGLKSEYANAANAAGTTSYTTPYPYVYNSHAVNIYPVVESYVNKLASEAGINITGKLMTYEQANSLSTNVRKDMNGWYYWFGSAKGPNLVGYVFSSGYINLGNAGISIGVRPVIIVSTSDI